MTETETTWSPEDVRRDYWTTPVFGLGGGMRRLGLVTCLACGRTFNNSTIGKNSHRQACPPGAGPIRGRGALR